MRITILPEGKQVELTGRRHVITVLSEHGYPPGTAMITRGDELSPEGETVEADDEIEVRAVISGGP